MRCLAIFDITSIAVLFERTCRKEGIPAKIVPVPRKLSASCGLACEYPCESDSLVREMCSRKNIPVSSFSVIGDDWT